MISSPPIIEVTLYGNEQRRSKIPPLIEVALSGGFFKKFWGGKIELIIASF